MLRVRSESSPWLISGNQIGILEQKDLLVRNRLLSILLQDRGVLRLISAPHGFGKTALAYGYAMRLFPQSNVVWIDGQDPDLVKSLDKMQFFDEQITKETCLVVIDDMPYLDEYRSSILAKNIDQLLYQGVEVIVTTLPSNDFLRDSQPDRILINATDLNVTEQECIDAYKGDESACLSFCAEQHKKGAAKLFGLTPYVMWDRKADTTEQCLLGFFKEALPLEFHKILFSMLVLGEGDASDIAHLEITLTEEYETMIRRDYPLVQIDIVQHSFVAPEYSIKLISQVLKNANCGDSLVCGTYPLAERLLSLLIDQGKAERASKLLEYFCSIERCALWLKERGWDLLDSGKIVLVDRLLKKCPDNLFAKDPSLVVLLGWVRGLVGEFREAQYYAQLATKLCEKTQEESSQTEFARMMAYLCEVAFSEGMPSIKKEVYCSGEVVTPENFLAAVIDLLDEEEVVHALYLGNGKTVQHNHLGCLRPSAEKIAALEMLFTTGAEKFHSTCSYRFALHFLQSVNSTDARILLQNMGCNIVFTARRKKIEHFSASLVIIDLWKGGYFGAGGQSTRAQDAELLNRVALLMGTLMDVMGRRFMRIPWEEKAQSNVDVNLLEYDFENRSHFKVEWNGREIPMLEVNLFGGFEVYLGGEVTPDSMWRKKLKTLLSILVLAQGRDVTREFIYEQLWPDTSHERAKDNFYVLWSQLNSILDSGPYLEREGEFCRINKHYVNSDVFIFEQLIRRLLTQKDESVVLVDIYARLEGLYKAGLVQSEITCPYIVREKEKYSAMYVDAMVTATEKALDVGDSKIGLYFAQKAIEEDCEREDVYYSLIRAQIACGQRCMAIRTYQKCKEYLREQLGLDPSYKTQELYNELITVDPSLIHLDSESFKQ